MYQDKKVIHLVARGLGGEIGADNKLLWHIPEDLKHFKDSTIGHVVLMGRKTVEGLPKPLSRRLVVMATKEWGDFKEFYTTDMLLNQCVSACFKLNTDKIFIAGGAQLYNSTFDIVDELWITQVFSEYSEADTFYHIPEGFEMFEEVMGMDTEELLFTFQKWKKVN